MRNWFALFRRQAAILPLHQAGSAEHYLNTQRSNRRNSCFTYGLPELQRRSKDVVATELQHVAEVFLNQLALF